MLTPWKPSTSHFPTWNSNIWTEPRASPSPQQTLEQKTTSTEKVQETFTCDTAVQKNGTMRTPTSCLHATLSNVGNTTASHAQKTHKSASHRSMNTVEMLSSTAHAHKHCTCSTQQPYETCQHSANTETRSMSL